MRNPETKSLSNPIVTLKPSFLHLAHLLRSSLEKPRNSPLVHHSRSFTHKSINPLAFATHSINPNLQKHLETFLKNPETQQHSETIGSFHFVTRVRFVTRIVMPYCECVDLLINNVGKSYWDGGLQIDNNSYCFNMRNYTSFSYLIFLTCYVSNVHLFIVF